VSSAKSLWRTDRGRGVRPEAGEVHREIEAVCPIHGVSIGKWDDPASWRIHFAPEATEEQKRLARQVIDRVTIQDLRPGRQPIRKMY
jgi:hypothetical protein